MIAFELLILFKTLEKVEAKKNDMEVIKSQVLQVKLTAEELVNEISKEEEATRQKLQTAEPALNAAENALKVLL